MDINYFLSMINKYDAILHNINSILEQLTEIDELDETHFLTKKYINKKDPSFFIFECEFNKNIFIEKQNRIMYLKSICKKYIEKLCNHDFVLDSIDIDLDRSKTISYCKFCGMSEPNF
jgi:hypothetical protein